MPIRNLILVPVLAALVAPAICQTTGSNPGSLGPKSAPTAAAPQAVVPALIPFSGVALAGEGKPLAGEAGVTFLIYKEQQGGEPLWAETQTVALDVAGHYKVQLGATTAAGMPLELFAAGDARWLEVQVAGEKPEPRIMLISVPYALKAADAETLGGLPASAFALAPAPGAAAETAHAAAAATPASSPAASNVTTSGGTVNAIPLFSTSTDIESSVITQGVYAAAPAVLIGTDLAPATLDVDRSVRIGSTRVGGQSYGTISMYGPPVLHQCCTSSLLNIFVGGAGNLNVRNGVRISALGSGALAAVTGSGAHEANGDTAVGYWALTANTTGYENTALGALAGRTTVQANENVTGSQNTFLGYASGPGTPTQLTNATAVGANAVVSADNSLVLGSVSGVNGATADTKVGIGTASPVATLDVEAPSGSIPTVKFGNLKIPAVFAVNGDTFLGGVLAVGEGTNVMSVAKDGIITFAPGQTFPGAGGGITAVTTTSPLTGASASGAVTLGLNTGALESTLNGVYAQLGAQNNFTQYQQMMAGLGVNGLLTAGSVSATEDYSGGSTVSGANTATSGFSSGGYFTSASPAGAAVVGLNSSGGLAALFAGSVTLVGSGNVATPSKPTNSSPLSLVAQAYSTQSGGELVNQTFQWEAVPVAATNNTANPSTTLNLLYGSGTSAAPATPAATGFSINSDGTLNFAANQSFPIAGTGGGTITGVTTTTPLTGSGTSGSVALGLNTQALEMTLNNTYAQLLAENLFVGYQQVQGGMSVTGALSTGGVTSVVSGSNAVYGQSLAASGTSNGGYFSTTSAAGSGVVGVNTAGGNAAYFQGNVNASNSASGTNVVQGTNSATSGMSNGGYFSTASPAGSGVVAVGTTNPVGNAGYFQGNVAVTGSTTTAQLGIGGDPVMSHNPHMVFSGYLLGDLGGGGYGLIGGYFVPDQNIAITRISASIQTPAQECTQDATVNIYTGGGSTIIASLNIPTGDVIADSGTLNPLVYVAAGSQLSIVSTGSGGCNSLNGNPTQNVFVNVQYVMQ